MDIDLINYELNIQKSNLLLLKEYLNKMNDLIQEDDSYDNSYKFMEMLKELKTNMDNTKNNISNLTVLRALLLNLKINSEEESNEDSVNETQSNSNEDTNTKQIADSKEDVKDDNRINQNIEPNEDSSIKSSEEKTVSVNNSSVNKSTETKKEILEDLKGEIKDDIDKDLYTAFILEADKEEKPESDEDSSIDILEENIEDNSEDVSEEINPDKQKSQEQVVAEYYEECFELLEKNFVVFYAFLLNYINSCIPSEDYYLSELSKEKQYAIEFIQNELMEKEIPEPKEENEEKQITVEKQIETENPLVQIDEDEENLKEILITNESNNKEDDHSIGTLIISEKDNKVILPYNEDDIKNILDTTTEYTSLEQIIDDKYTIPLDRYKNPALSRFRETYNLMKKRQKASMADSLDLALELAFNSSLNPAIITACKNLEQLDSYLTCAELNEIDKFEYFKIKYEMSPLKK